MAQRAFYKIFVKKIEEFTNPQEAIKKVIASEHSGL